MEVVTKKEALETFKNGTMNMKWIKVDQITGEPMKKRNTYGG